MTDYKNTLNLPHTDFPMKANLPKQEPERLIFWQEKKIYQQLRKLRAGAKKFILHDGPLYANGQIHIGHAVNRILKDIVVKSKSLSGFDAPFVPGWDCHGLPIELNVEKKLGKKTVSPKEFRQACRDYAESQVEIQREAFIRLGIFGEWNNPYLTMNFSYEADIIRSLKKIIENGHLHRGFKPVHWCIECGSALAEAEVEYQNKTSKAIDVRFRVVDETAFLDRFEANLSDAGEGPISIPIWTTTPWTLPANQAVSLNPNLSYALIQVETDQGSERLLIAEELLDNAIQRYAIKKESILLKTSGQKLAGILLKHPFYDRNVPIVLGEHVTVETGTGAVHTAPAHGLDDYLVAIRYDLPLNNPVNSRGLFIPDTPLVGGKHVVQVNDYIIEILNAHGMLLRSEAFSHSYPHCWRHKTPLIFRATPQWFISMDQNGLRQTALQAISQVNWIPDWGKTRIFGMIDGRPDWCISRQRNWCVPMAFFVHKETGELHPETPKLLAEVANQVEKNGIEAWYQIDKPSLLGKEADDYEPSSDTLDVWFDSGVSHTGVLKARPDLHYPADLYLEGSDQHRGWFNSSLLTASAMYGTAPYRSVLTHGFTVDAEGRKMSKSLGNVIAPEKVIDSLGADILRFWVATTDYRGEIAVSDEILKRNADNYRRIRNTARFLLANLHDFDPNIHSLMPEQLLSLDRWAILRALSLQTNIQKNYDDYQFHLVCQQLHNFCAIELGSFYLDIIKDRQYTVAKDAIARRSAQTAMYHILHMLVRWMAPILSFTAEEIWQYLPAKTTESVFLLTWYENLSLSFEQDRLNKAYDLLKETSPASNCLAYWQILMRIREIVNKEIENLRNQGQLGAPLEAEVTLYFPEKTLLFELLHTLNDELRFIFITSKANVVIGSPENNASRVTFELDSTETTFYIEVLPSNNPKCIRCWHRKADVGQIANYPDICTRCVENIENASGETRYYA